MKTRIVYPTKLWYDKRMASLDIKGTLLAIYLMTNKNIGLSPIYQQHDLEIRFILKLSEVELRKYKEQLEALGLFKFFDEWVEITNDLTYCDYFGQQKVLDSKKKEIENIPLSVKEKFKGLNTSLEEVRNPLETTLNHKSKTINHKEGGVEETRFDLDWLKNIDQVTVEELAKKFDTTEAYVRDKAEKVLDYCSSKGKRYLDYKATLRNWIRDDDKKPVATGKRLNSIVITEEDMKLSPEEYYRKAGKTLPGKE